MLLMPFSCFLAYYLSIPMLMFTLRSSPCHSHDHICFLLNMTTWFVPLYNRFRMSNCQMNHGTQLCCHWLACRMPLRICRVIDVATSLPVSKPVGFQFTFAQHSTSSATCTCADCNTRSNIYSCSVTMFISYELDIGDTTTAPVRWEGTSRSRIESVVSVMPPRG